MKAWRSLTFSDNAPKVALVLLNTIPELLAFFLKGVDLLHASFALVMFSLRGRDVVFSVRHVSLRVSKG